jgi:hypothetical protein
MKSLIFAAFTGLIAILPIRAVPAERDHGASARELLQGCLLEPSKDATAKLAMAVGGAPYSDVRIRHELGHHEVSTVVDDNTRPGEAQRTETTVTAFSGWDLPGPSAGSLEYSEGEYRMARVEVATGQLITAWKAARTHECRVVAPVANARSIFELYEKIHRADYGILVSADRRWISVFTFEPDQYDVELQFQLDAPLAGLPVASSDGGNSRLIITDGGPLFDGDPGPGVPSVKLTRAALLSGLDHAADMTFVNEISDPIVQRLS